LARARAGIVAGPPRGGADVGRIAHPCPFSDARDCLFLARNFVQSLKRPCKLDVASQSGNFIDTTQSRGNLMRMLSITRLTSSPSRLRFLMMPPDDVAVAKRSSVTRHHVRDALQRMIISGERRPGSKLRQQELAEHFHVAQGVIREALLELQAYGLVETIDRRGVFVTKLDREKLLEAFEVREMHEGLAARLCCDRVTRAQVRQLMDMAEEIYQLGTAQKLTEMGSLDRGLHSQLIHLCGNKMLARLADNYRVLGKFVRADRDPTAVRDEHLAILQAIGDGRADDAERLIRQHVAAARLAVEKQLDSGDFEPQWVV
jgi:DNA-binding GntR family transcriptional regulator